MPYHCPSGLLTQLKDYALQLGNNLIRGSKEREDYPLAVLFTASGMGKTRTGEEALSLFKQFEHEFPSKLGKSLKYANRYSIDFNGGGDAIRNVDLNMDPCQAMGIRLASNCILQCSYHELLDKFSNPISELAKFFDTNAALHALREEEKRTYPELEYVITFLHIDEFHIAHNDCVERCEGVRGQRFVKNMIYSIAEYMTGDGIDNRHLIIPLFTSTAPLGLNFELTRYMPKYINLRMLSKAQALDILHQTLGEVDVNTILREKSFQEFIQDIGVVPRELRRVKNELLNIFERSTSSEVGLQYCMHRINERISFRFRVPSHKMSQAILKLVITKSQFYLDQELAEGRSILSVAADGILFLIGIEDAAREKDWDKDFVGKESITNSSKFIAIAPTKYMEQLTGSAFPTKYEFIRKAKSIFSTPAEPAAGTKGEENFAAMLCLRRTLFSNQKLSFEQLFPNAEISLRENPLIEGEQVDVEYSDKKILRKKGDEIILDREQLGNDKTVTLCKDSTFGIDIVSIMNTEAPQPVLLAIQTKFGHSSRSNYLNKFIEAIQTLRNKIRSHYVIACIAVQGNIANIDHLRKQLDRDMIMYYGSSVHSVAHFFVGAEHRYGINQEQV